MHALQDFFTTDDGLLSALVMAAALAMGVLCARFIERHLREAAEAAAQQSSPH